MVNRIKVGVLLVVVLLALICILNIPLIRADDISENTFLDNIDSQDGPKIDKSLEEKFDENETINVIIIFDDASSTNEISSLESKNNAKKVSTKTLIKAANDLDNDVVIDSIDGFDQDKKIGIINGYSGSLTRDGLDEIINSNANVRVVEDKILYIDGSVDGSGSEEKILGDSAVHSALSIGVESTNANYSHNSLGMTGIGVKIGFIDTGIDYTHPDLGLCYGNNTNTSCRVFGGYDFYNDDSNPIDDNTAGHGTHVAGIAAANGVIVGVAPNATLYALKACSSSGSCPTSNVLSSIDWAVNNSLDVLSISLGSYASYDDKGNTGFDVLSLAVDNAVRQGVTVVLSSGNNGPGVSTINTPGAATLAITVGAIVDNGTITTNDDLLWTESSVGPAAFGRMDPEIVAPGYQIISTALGDYYALTGTSMATPFVSGAAVLLLEQNPNLTPAQVRAMLMQSTTNISGKLFQRGTGELNIKNALINNLTVQVSHINSYGVLVADDRWEFVVTPYTTSNANVTIINTNGYNVSFNVLFDAITNMENNVTLNINQIGVPTSVNATNNTNYTFSVNFTLSNYSSTYATTYGGIIVLNGSMNNGSQILSRVIKIPIVITVPIMNRIYVNTTMRNDPDGTGGYSNSQPTHEDVYYYCYYSTNPTGMFASVNWTSSSNWLALYLYNSTAGFLSSAKDSGTNYQNLSTTNTDSFKWIRVDGYDFTAPLVLNLNVTNPNNRAPSLLNITPIGGIINSTNTLLFYRPNNVTFNITYNDSDNDSVVISISDPYSSTFSIYNSTNVPNGSAVYGRNITLWNNSIHSNVSINITLTDISGDTTTTAITILYLSPISVNNYTPSNTTVYSATPSNISFTVDATEANSNTLYYYWTINGTLNSTTQNFTLNTSALTGTWYNISVFIGNSQVTNSSNQSISWNVYLDSSSPSLSLNSPTNSTYNDSRIDFNYSSSDSLSGVDKCWYSINGTLNVSNTTLSSCANLTFYLNNGLYTLILYSNDTTSNLASSIASFNVTDITYPSVISTLPSGSQASTSSVLLQIVTTENATCKYDTTDVAYDLMASSFTNFVTIHNATYSVSSGDYIIYTRCSDMNNNTNNASTNISFTINASSGGGGGGGGGGSSGGSSSGGGSSGGGSITGIGGGSSSSKTINVVNGSNNFSFNNKNVPVSQVDINSSSEIPNVTIGVSKVNNVESNYTNNVSAYINLTAQNIESNNLLNVKIYFSVTHEWLDLNNITENDVIMLQYDPSNESWNGLNTSMISEDNKSVYFVATTAHVGLYAISFENKTGGTNEEVIPLVEEKKNDTILNKSSEPMIHSGENSASQSAAALINEKISELLEKQETFITGIFAFALIVIGIMISIMRHYGPNHSINLKKYSDDIVVSTNNELKHIGVKSYGSPYKGNLPPLPNFENRGIVNRNVQNNTSNVQRPNNQNINRTQNNNVNASVKKNNLNLDIPINRDNLPIKVNSKSDQQNVKDSKDSNKDKFKGFRTQTFNRQNNFGNKK